MPPFSAAFSAVRGATTADANTSPAILEAGEELLKALMKRNALKKQHLLAAFFTATKDLTAAFPAEAARGMGINTVPLLCAQEIPVKGALKRCLRVLLITTKKKPLKPVYLKGARTLRPDIAGAQQ